LFGVTFAQTWPPVTNFTYYWNPQAGDTVTFQKWSANNDSVRNGTGRIITELNQNCVHFNQGTQNHDSTVKYVQIDTIRGNPDIDSIKGNPNIDSSVIGVLDVGTLSSDSLNIGTAGWVKCDTGSFACTTVVNGGAGSASGDSVGTGRYFKIGNFVSVYLDGIDVTYSGVIRVIVNNFPSSLCPNNNAQLRVPVANSIADSTISAIIGISGVNCEIAGNNSSEISFLLENPSFTYYMFDE